MSTSVPQVPPRPTRASKDTSAAPNSLSPDVPRVPPRPAGRRTDRSVSPGRESFARSPFNEHPNQPIQRKPSVGKNGNREGSQSDLPERPPSVVLPSIGQEGNEYAQAFTSGDELGTSPTQTRIIANDLKLHAPKPALATSTAKQRVSTVTRTDSGQAAAYGIGKAGSADDKEPSSRPLKQKASFASAQSEVSVGTERPASSADSEHGIPEIGQRVPMYPHAGDVQAPSPSPFQQPFAPGIGFHNDGSKPKHHSRKLSAHEHNVPLEAYGRHGHQVLPHHHDRFEKAYYEKHPELYKKELGQYGEGRPEWAMSSDDLNKIVRDTASRGAGLGTSPAVMGTPSEQVGFQASEEYASRMSSPQTRPVSAVYPHGHSNTSQTHVESPLRKASFPGESAGGNASSLGMSLKAPSELALASEAEEDDVIHVNPMRQVSKIHGGAGRMDSTEDLGPTAENEGYHDEHHYSTPILASDEIAKEPFGYELQPAVSPLQERHGAYHEEGGFYHHNSTSQTSLSNSRPTSRPGSIHGAMSGLQVPSERTKLEDLEEYEPLFPEEDEKKTTERPLTAADRFKRPELKNRKFPSQDVWEDSPDSVHHTATVSTPQLPEDNETEKMTRPDETPEQAFARRQEELAEKETVDKNSFLNKEKKPWGNKAQMVDETRPGSQQRFPSRDIWEDTPDSLQLQTTVERDQSPEREIPSPMEGQLEERPTTGAVTYHQEKAAAGIPLASDEGRATTGIAATLKPAIPSRPVKSSKLAQSPENSQPAVPDRPRKSSDTAVPPVPTKTKPVIPARTSKPLTRESSENLPLSHVTSNTSTKSIGSDQGSAAAAKPKPPVPSRPVGSKIAALPGGFMADLNKRLQLGAQPPKKEEPIPEPEVEKEKVPLVDARKGRARGPARRAPAAKSPSPNAAAVSSQEKPTLSLSFSVPATLWEIDPEEDLLHVSTHKDSAEPEAPTKTSESETPTLATNKEGSPVHEPLEIAEGAEKASSLPSAAADEQSQKLEEVQKASVISGADESNEQSQPVKVNDEPPVTLKSETSNQVQPKHEEGEEEDMTGSTATLKATEEASEVPLPKEENVE